MWAGVVVMGWGSRGGGDGRSRGGGDGGADGGVSSWGVGSGLVGVGVGVLAMGVQGVRSRGGRSWLVGSGVQGMRVQGWWWFRGGDPGVGGVESGVPGVGVHGVVIQEVVGWGSRGLGVYVVGSGVVGRDPGVGMGVQGLGPGGGRSRGGNPGVVGCRVQGGRV